MDFLETLISNMVVGVSTGFVKSLKLSVSVTEHYSRERTSSFSLVIHILYFFQLLKG
jgi:ribosomal protein L6P/L9E